MPTSAESARLSRGVWGGFRWVGILCASLGPSIDSLTPLSKYKNFTVFCTNIETHLSEIWGYLPPSQTPVVPPMCELANSWYSRPSISHAREPWQEWGQTPTQFYTCTGKVLISPPSQ